MNEFASTKQRRLHKKQDEVEYRRTITIEGDEPSFVVAIEDVRSSIVDYGLQDPKSRSASTGNVTVSPKATPPMTLKEAVEFANEEFRRSVEYEQLVPLPIGASE